MPIRYNPKKRALKMIKSNKDIYEFFHSSMMNFPKEILTRYFLSIKTKPFVILTGISGTGKTKIAQVFASYFLQDLDPEERIKRYSFIPVRPDWMDNKGLLGYFNLLDNKYHTTPMLRLILDAVDNPEIPYFVILDEMNLAKVEQYFSDFLSILESRTSDNPGGEEIILHDMGSAIGTDGSTIPNRICVPPNVFITGTVNVDESTYMFSPKVLDRANVIEFNAVDIKGYDSGLTSHPSNFVLHDPDIRNSLLDSASEPFSSIRDFQNLKKMNSGIIEPISRLHELLQSYNMHFGYRVINEISRFLLFSSEYVTGDSMENALDIQFVQKVVPKFHGTQGRLQPVLEDILSFCFDSDQKPGEELIASALSDESPARFPRTALKAVRMLQQVRSQGYTSFIE